MLPNVDCYQRAAMLLRMIADETKRCFDGIERKDAAYALDQAQKMKRQCDQLVFDLDLADLIDEHNAREPQGRSAAGGQ